MPLRCRPSRPRPTEAPAPPIRLRLGRPRAAARALCVASVVVCASARPATAQDWLLVQGIVDLEGWETDSGSILLTRNEGRPTALARVRLWGAVEVHPRLQLYALGKFEAGAARPEGGSEAELEQIALRYLHSRRLVIDVGRLLTPVGAFANRRFSTVNPLIGSPDAYPVTYPWGVQVTGSSGRFDYRAALVSLPVAHEVYVPEPSHALRPAAGAGVTVTTGLRTAMSLTRGPYLNREIPATLLAGGSWNDFDQRVLAFDAQFSRGHFECRAELALSDYEVPNRPEPVSGTAYYVEIKYTWSPRFFSAIRGERNRYAFVRAVGDQFWIARSVDFVNAEVGVGYRLRPGTLVKASFRKDDWNVDEDLRRILRNGYAVSVQFAHQFDVMSWLSNAKF